MSLKVQANIELEFHELSQNRIAFCMWILDTPNATGSHTLTSINCIIWLWRRIEYSIDARAVDDRACGNRCIQICDYSVASNFGNNKIWWSSRAAVPAGKCLTTVRPTRIPIPIRYNKYLFIVIAFISIVYYYYYCTACSSSPRSISTIHIWILESAMSKPNSVWVRRAWNKTK